MRLGFSRGQDVLDLGCGSGILAIAAAKLGASKVLALDTDELAVAAAEENAAVNAAADEDCCGAWQSRFHFALGAAL